MKLRILFLLLISCLTGNFVFAQVIEGNATETVFNPRTGAMEQRVNIFNQEKVASEAAQRDAQYGATMNGLYDSQRRASSEFLAQQAEARNRDLKDLSAKLYQEAVQRVRVGQTRIKAGQASTSFRNTQFSLVSSLLESATTPELKQKVNQFAALNLKQFRDEIRVRGLLSNDVVDGQALAFVICYEIYFGQKPSKVHLDWVRQNSRRSLLKNAYFQGGDDGERQRKYETNAAMTMYAKMINEKGANNANEAKDIAENVLQFIWENSAETLYMTATGFMHKGSKIIADGKSTFIYNYNPNLKAAQKLAESGKQTFGDNIGYHAKNYQNSLNLFYQEMERRGGRKGDLAWCATISTYANYLVVADGKELNPKQFKSVFEFIKNAILKSPDAQAASDKNKQLACETFAIKSATEYQRFLQDPQGNKGRGGKETAQNLLKNIFEALAVDLNNYQLTEAGIVKLTKN